MRSIVATFEVVNLAIYPRVPLGMAFEDQIVDGDHGFDAALGESKGQFMAETMVEVDLVLPKEGAEAHTTPPSAGHFARLVDVQRRGCEWGDCRRFQTDGRGVEVVVMVVLAMLKEFLDQGAAVVAQSCGGAKQAFGIKSDLHLLPVLREVPHVRDQVVGTCLGELRGALRLVGVAHNCEASC